MSRVLAVQALYGLQLHWFVGIARVLFKAVGESGESASNLSCSVDPFKRLAVGENSSRSPKTTEISSRSPKTTYITADASFRATTVPTP